MRERKREKDIELYQRKEIALKKSKKLCKELVENEEIKK